MRAALWWKLESQLRQDLAQPVTLDQLCQRSGKSPASISRACAAAVGLSPMKRWKQVRLGVARGLVQRTDLMFKEIASRVGYPRIHEFSRDYKHAFSITPTQDRAANQP